MKKKSSLKLRKGVLISIPIALLLAVLVGVLIVNNRKANLKTAKKVEVKSEKFIDDSMGENNRSFSDTEFIKNYVEFKNKRLIDNTIAYYADQFHLDKAKVVEVARRLTNNYEREDYLTNFSIKPGDGSFSSYEAGIVYLVWGRWNDDDGSSCDVA